MGSTLISVYLTDKQHELYLKNKKYYNRKGCDAIKKEIDYQIKKGEIVNGETQDSP